jgi:hypothetical protein
MNQSVYRREVPPHWKFHQLYWHLAGSGQEQGDQIGQIFAYWPIVYFGQIFLKNCKMAHSF